MPSRATGHRRSIRLPGYDYTQAGAYFVTLCTHQGEELFGQVTDAGVILTACGRIARDAWLATPTIRCEITLDVFVVMPNHLHGIVIIGAVVAAQALRPLANDLDANLEGRMPSTPTNHGAIAQRVPKSLGAMIAGYKATVTRQTNAIRDMSDAPVWQRSYYEHIIRSERALDAIRRYIVNNPARWNLDRYNRVATGSDPWAVELVHLLDDDRG